MQCTHTASNKVLQTFLAFNYRLLSHKVSRNKMSSNDDLNDETFLKEFLKDFYHCIIKSDNYENFEDILKEWVQDYFNNKEKNPEIILKLMENHEENDNWFSSLIGFFYDHGIGDTVIDKNKSLKSYLLAININKNENKKLISMYQLLNIIISKYLLSFYYYKEIILYKRDLIEKEFGYLENVHVVMSHNQVENFNGLEINLCKDEINTMENFFESQDKGFNEIQIEKKKLIELNNLAEGGNSDAQNNLGYCYQNGIGITKDEKKAFEWS
ncbi:unnamed protein product [Rhizophagus irregularis]|nr:unnamed protein product [Rhizophagus irregularis]